MSIPIPLTFDRFLVRVERINRTVIHPLLVDHLALHDHRDSPYLTYIIRYELPLQHRIIIILMGPHPTPLHRKADHPDRNTQIKPIESKPINKMETTME